MHIFFTFLLDKDWNTNIPFLAFLLTRLNGMLERNIYVEKQYRFVSVPIFTVEFNLSYQSCIS